MALLKIVYIQYAGDFDEAYKRLIIQQGNENYYGQAYSVKYVVKQARNKNDITVLVLQGHVKELTLLETNLKASNYGGENVYQKLFDDIKAISPDRVILRIPDPKILKYLRKSSIKTFPVFADSFESFGKFRGKILKYRLSKELKSQHINYIGNHQINASKSLMNLGISAKKIIPYDWPHSDSPENWQKKLPEDITTKKLKLFYAGQLKVSKGLQDLIHAIKILLAKGKEVHLDIAGQGDLDTFQKLVEKLNLQTKVTFLGSIDHSDVLRHMNSADFVVVPSRHEYPEGLPMTIMESLMVHTPVLASDHPMFVGRVGTKGGVIFFKEKNVEDLVIQILHLISDRDLYVKTCEMTSAEWHALELKLKWGDMIDAWLYENDSELEINSLNKHLYQAT